MIPENHLYVDTNAGVQKLQVRYHWLKQQLWFSCAKKLLMNVTTGPAVSLQYNIISCPFVLHTYVFVLTADRNTSNHFFL